MGVHFIQSNGFVIPVQTCDEQTEREEWESCLVYLDGVIVFSRTFEEHLKRLAQVLQRVRQEGLKDEFILRTDHDSLRWLQSFRDPDAQWARWQESPQFPPQNCAPPGRTDEPLVEDEGPVSPINAVNFTANDTVRLKQQNDPGTAALLTAKRHNDLMFLPRQRTKAISVLAANSDRLHIKMAYYGVNGIIPMAQPTYS
ncbi:hypothetical protein D918_08646 [Trichuris suis]|nr:hypothetical protein D918_08646 [Trichuris suis]